MPTDKKTFAIRASASRLNKGLLAIPRRFGEWFPKEKCQIDVFFDDEGKTRTLTFHPYDPVVKESRIFGLASWFSRRGVQEGDLISITVEDLDRRTYRIALDRYIREREEQQARRKLRIASDDSEAVQGLNTISRLTGRRTHEVAREELLRILHESQAQRRPRVQQSSGARHEGVPPGIRILLRELHDGKCQLCSFTFEKRSGEPYFEVHHLDPEVGHHPTNLLVVCPNCHAQFEHATVTDFKWIGNWLIGVTINGKRVHVRQPLAHDSVRRVFLGLLITCAASKILRTSR